MFEPSLDVAARAAVSLTTLALVWVMARALGRGRAGHAGSGGRGLLVGLVLAWSVAAAFSHVQPLTALLPLVFPLGVVLGLAVATASLARPAARDAFDALSDGEVRYMLAFRGIYGALLLALAALERIPLSFGLAAGLGDLAVAWLSAMMPGAISIEGKRWPRLLLHGTGLLDLLQALALAVIVVRPWSLAHANSTTSMTLPWVAVPLMVALNAHGIRQAWRSSPSSAHLSHAGHSREPERHGSEPAGGVRRAIS
jgi:hypothetical protein